MSPNDAANLALDCFKKAWLESIKDYGRKRINSEPCLQSAQYFHLRNQLTKKDADFKIFVECSVKLQGTELAYFDTLVAHKNKVVLAIELKYKPKSKPKDDDVVSDLNKLSSFKKWTSEEEKLEVNIRRYLGSERSDAVNMTVAPSRKIIFASFVKSDVFPSDEKTFWGKYGVRCADADWIKKRIIPYNLCICLAEASKDGTATPNIYGGRSTKV